MQKVLIIEDDLMIADMLEEVLSLDSFEVCGIARNMQHALSLAATHKPELAIVDVFLADGSLGTDIAAVLIDLYDTGTAQCANRSIYTTCQPPCTTSPNCAQSRQNPARCQACQPVYPPCRHGKGLGRVDPDC